MSVDRLEFLRKESDDGFATAEVEAWQRAKQHFIDIYLKANTNRIDLRNKNKLIIDIGCGPGFNVSDDGLGAFVGSPLRALALDETINRFIFIDRDPDYLRALDVRVKKFFPQKNVLLLDGNINEVIETLPHYIPAKQDKLPNAPLALVDTYSFDVHFETIQLLSELNVDLLLINAFPHTGIHTYEFYLDEQRELLNDFFGFPWARVGEMNEIKSDEQFFLLAMKAYGQQLKSLGYNVATSLQKYTPAIGGSPYFQIAYCTKSRLFNKVHKEATSNSVQQIDLFE